MRYSIRWIACGVAVDVVDVVVVFVVAAAEDDDAVVFGHEQYCDIVTVLFPDFEFSPFAFLPPFMNFLNIFF